MLGEIILFLNIFRQDVCKFAKDNVDSGSVMSIFYASAVSVSLGNCKVCVKSWMLFVVVNPWANLTQSLYVPSSEKNFCKDRFDFLLCIGIEMSVKVFVNYYLK